MNESEQRDDLTEGWPADPRNEELARFAGKLQAALPVLPPDALERVGQKVHAELARQARRRVRLGLAAAASVLLALGVGGYVWLRPPPGERTPAPVEDRYTVELAVPQAPLPPQPPLVRLEEHQSLYAD
jgi:hypothetical protein